VSATVWVLGRVTAPPAWAAAPQGKFVLAWGICGIFTTRENAVAVHRDPSFFVGPIPIDDHLPLDMVVWQNIEWPWSVDPKACPMEPGHLATPKPHGP
jgi:hypothetical protein